MKQKLLFYGTLLMLLFGFFVYVVFKYFYQTSDSEVTTKELVRPQLCEKEMLSIVQAGEAAQLGDAYFGGELGYDLRCARMAYLRAIQIDEKGDLQVWHQLGRIDFLQRNYATAIASFEKQIELFGDTLPNVYYMLGLTYGYSARESGNAEEWIHAEESFKKFLTFIHAAPWARVDLAWIYFAQGKFEDMLPVLEEGLTYSPSNPWLLNMYGLALFNTGERDRSLDFFKRALEETEKLTPEDWGKSYPGNDPKSWEIGLNEMKRAIAYNVELMEMNGIE